MRRSNRNSTKTLHCISNIEYASAICETIFISNPNYHESRYVFRDFEWENYDLIPLTKHEKGIPSLISLPELFSDETDYASIVIFEEEPNKTYRTNPSNMMKLDWYSEGIMKYVHLPKVIKFLQGYHHQLRNKNKTKNKQIHDLHKKNKSTNKQMKQLQNKMIDPKNLALQYGSYLGVNIYGSLNENGLKQPQMKHVRCPRMWWKRYGRKFFKKMSKRKYKEGGYICFTKIKMKQFIEWIPPQYLSKTDENGEYSIGNKVIKYNPENHWVQIHYVVHLDDTMNIPHNVVIEH